LSDPSGTTKCFPLRRFKQNEWRCPPCRQCGPRLSWSFGALQSFHPTLLAAVLVSLRPSCPWRFRWTSGSSQGRTPALARSKSRSPLLSFRPPSENSTHRAANTPGYDRGRRPRCRLLPWGFFPFSVSPPGAAASINRASHSPIACASRFSQPPGALVRPEPAGLVSCQIRSWGSPFRVLLLPCSRSPSPAPLPSCRWAALPFSPRTSGPSQVPKHRAESKHPHAERAS
jgi:hypothetical protein